MKPWNVVCAEELPGGVPIGMRPDAILVSSFELAARVGISVRAMDRLLKRHRRELRSYGPLVAGAAQVVSGEGRTFTETLLTVDQRTLVLFLSETEAGAAERAAFMTTATMAGAGLDPYDPDLPEFKTPDEVRRWTAKGRHLA